MNKRLISLILLLSSCYMPQETITMTKIDTIKKAEDLFPKSVSEINNLIAQIKKQTLGNLEEFYSVKPEDRNFENTIRKLDSLSALYTSRTSPISILEMVSPDQDIREAANKAVLDITNFSIDNFSQNKKIYQAYKDYLAHNDINKLNPEEKYTVEQSMKDFKRNGYELPDAIQDKIKLLNKELATHIINFDRIIADANDTVKVTAEELAGLDPEFIETLKKDGNLYILGVDNPTYTRVMENCSVSSTRKAIWLQYNNRAYPANISELQNVVKIRDEIAKTLGFENYASLDLDNQMAHDTKTVDKFLKNLIEKTQLKAKQEIAVFARNLPENITLAESGIFNPWDLDYVKNQYKKKHLDIDEQKIAEYFPLESTIKALFDIYQKFFGIEFKKNITKTNFWHSNVEMLEVYKDNKFIGYILLDLFPRDNKYSHACEITISPTFDNGKEYYPAYILVIANFPKPTNTKPSLLNRNEARTFFHEFGHALHAILGTTELAGNSGVNVKTDFVEMPSQMLEEWLWQPQFLKETSKHYITGEQLPDDMINKILSLKNFDSGLFCVRQLYYATLSLNIYKSGNTNIHELNKKIFNDVINYAEYNDDIHTYASFGHLTSYGAKYYGYMWSKVFALDLFDVIKKNNFSPAIGKKYVDTVLSKGGSDDPKNLLYNFLGREPREEAFLKDIGI